MGEGGNANAAIDTLAPECLALPAATVVIEGGQRLGKQALVVAAVIDHALAAVGPIGKVGALDEVLAPYLDLIELQMSRDGVDRTLGDVGALGSAIAAIGVDWHGVGDDDPRQRLVVLDLVGAGAEIDGILRRAAGRHVGK